MNTREVTKEEFERFVDVQVGGKYNMLDPRARQATGLSKEVYTEILTNYGILKAKFHGGN